MISREYALRRRLMININKASASLTPASGVNYTSGLDGLTVEDFNTMATIISNEPTITRDAGTVYVDYGDTHRELKAGHGYTIPLNGTAHSFVIIGFNHDELTNINAYGKATATGKSGITLHTYHMFAGQTYNMNTTGGTTGGWRDSRMRTSTMPLMKSYMPAEWQSAIVPVNKITSKGMGSSDLVTTSDDCFLLSEREIFGILAEQSAPNEGLRYIYYKSGGSTIKKIGSTATTWWERSPSIVNTSRFCYVTTQGTAGAGSITGSRGVAFAFCL